MTATLELPVIPETGTLYDHCAAWMTRRSEDGTPIVNVGKMRFPMTRSGDAVLTTLTDDEADALVPGDIVIRETGRGVAPLYVRRVRMGVAYDARELPYEVSVVEGTLEGWSHVWAVGSLLTVTMLEAA